MKKTLFYSFLLCCISFTTAYAALEPLEALRGPIDKVVSILKDSQHQNTSKAESERERLWDTMRGLFNFTEMAKRTLARNWRRFAPQQRKAFSEVFGKFLGNTYLNKIQKGYQNEKVVYLGQQKVSDSRAIVKTKIVRENVEIPVNYSMKTCKGAWRVYDVNIEGVSLVKNYRSQFNKLLMKNSPAQLIERLKKKVEKQKTSKVFGPLCRYPA